MKAYEIRMALGNVPDDADINISIDVSRHGETEEEAGRRAFGTKLFETIRHQGRDGEVASVDLLFDGYINDEN